MEVSLAAEWVEIPVREESAPMEGYLARPAQAGGSWPGVLVLMEIFGVNAHMRDVTERLARQGYTALAINYYHRTTRNLELGYTEADVAEGRRHKDKTTRDGLLVDVRAAIEYLMTCPEVSPKDRFATIGFCFGAHVAYIAAIFPEIAATASYYGGGIATMSPGGGPPTVDHTPDIKGAMLCFFGEADPLIPSEQTILIETALKLAHIPHTVIRYPGVDHGFNCDQRASYNPAAAENAWRRTLQLFADRLKQEALAR